MKHDFFTVTKKEFKRFFGDKRLFFSTVILPGLMIFIIYSIMGNVMKEAFSPDEKYTPKVYAVNAPESIQDFFKKLDTKQKQITLSEADKIKSKIKDQKVDMLIVFPENFEESVKAFDVMTATQPAPQVEVYYNSAATESSALFGKVSEGLSQYESSIPMRIMN